MIKRLGSEASKEPEAPETQQLGEEDHVNSEHPSLSQQRPALCCGVDLVVRYIHCRTQ